MIKKHCHCVVNKTLYTNYKLYTFYIKLFNSDKMNAFRYIITFKFLVISQNAEGEVIYNLKDQKTQLKNTQKFV